MQLNFLLIFAHIELPSDPKIMSALQIFAISAALFTNLYKDTETIARRMNFIFDSS